MHQRSAHAIANEWNADEDCTLGIGATFRRRTEDDPRHDSD